MKLLTVTIGLSLMLGVLTPLVGGAQERVEGHCQVESASGTVGG